MFRGYPLGESAIVAEVCNLIFANLPSGYQLKCEQEYRKLFPSAHWPQSMRARSRLDLAVFKSCDKADTKLEVAIEVKRAKVPKAQIEADLQRLAAAKSADPRLSCYLLVVSEAWRPSQFVTSTGDATRKLIPFGSGSAAKVRRVCKASSSFRKINRAHYSCLIEVIR